MGACKYCGQAAGLLRSKHSQCEARHNESVSRMIELTHDCIVEGEDLRRLKTQLEQLSISGFVSENETRNAVLQGWSNAVETYLDDGVLSVKEESGIERFQSHFGLSQEELDFDGSYMRVVKGAVLRDILNGSIPERVQVTDEVPFNLQKSEQLVWLFKDVDYYEERSKTHYEGGHHGISVKIAKGLYYRAGTFKGHPVVTSQIVHLDTGLMGVTNKHIYFTGPRKSFRVKFDKVVSFTPYDNGIGLQREAASARPQVFVTGDGWFTHNLITNMARL